MEEKRIEHQQRNLQEAPIKNIFFNGRNVYGPGCVIIVSVLLVCGGIYCIIYEKQTITQMVGIAMIVIPVGGIISSFFNKNK